MGPGQRMVLRTGLIFLVVVTIALVPVDVRTAPRAASGGCEECHDDFVPFEVVARSPKTIVAGEEVFLECHVYNDGQHEVLDVVAELTGPGIGSDTMVEEFPFSGSVSRTSGMFHAFEVKEGAKGLSITMTEDAGPLGQGDARLVLATPSGDHQTANSGGSTEEIVLDTEQMAAAGTGQFEMAVDQVGGLRPVPYTIEVQVEYWNAETVRRLGDIGPGEEASESWNVTPTEDGVKGYKVVVTGIATHSHKDGDKAQAYTVEQAFSAGAVRKGEATFEIKPYRNGLGYVLIGIMVASLITGFPKTRLLIPGLKAGSVLRFHCALSWSMVMVIAIHAYLASLTHPPWSPAVLTGETITTVFVALSLVPTMDWLKGGSRLKAISMIGRKNWMLVNRIALLVTLVVLGVHIYA